MFCFLSISGTLCSKGRRVRMLVACWGNGTWSSPGRCSTLCMPCFARPQVTGSPIPSTPHPIATPTTSATSSSWVAWWPRQSMITGYWSATSPAASTSTSWERASGTWVVGGFSLNHYGSVPAALIISPNHQFAALNVGSSAGLWVCLFVCCCFFLI